MVQAGGGGCWDGLRWAGTSPTDAALWWAAHGSGWMPCCHIAWWLVCPQTWMGKPPGRCHIIVPWETVVNHFCQDHHQACHFTCRTLLWKVAVLCSSGCLRGGLG